MLVQIVSRASSYSGGCSIEQVIVCCSETACIFTVVQIRCEAGTTGLVDWPVYAVACWVHVQVVCLVAPLV